MTNEKKLTVTKEERAMLRKLFWRNNNLMFCTSNSKQQGTTYGWVLIPFLEKIYGKNTTEFYEAMSRHHVFFNTNPGVAPFIFGLSIAMEEENKKAQAQGQTFETDSITALKTSLMGPLAGKSDSFYTGSLRIIATALSIGLSQQGSLLGPLIFLLAYNIPNILIRWWAGVYGYKVGGRFIEEMLASGTLKAITKGFSVLSLILIGAMTAHYVAFTTSFVAEIGTITFDFQVVFDHLLPGLLPLAITLTSFVYLKKTNKPEVAMLAMFIISIVLTLLGMAN